MISSADLVWRPRESLQVTKLCEGAILNVPGKDQCGRPYGQLSEDDFEGFTRSLVCCDGGERDFGSWRTAKLTWQQRYFRSKGKRPSTMRRSAWFIAMPFAVIVRTNTRKESRSHTQWVMYIKFRPQRRGKIIVRMHAGATHVWAQPWALWTWWLIRRYTKDATLLE